MLASLPPGQALEAWLHQMVDYMATKRVVAPALQASPGEGSALYAASGSTITAALERLARAAIASGEIRADLEPGDLLRLIAGLSVGYDRPDWPASARRLIGILMAGLRAGG